MITSHAVDRIENRLSGIITKDDEVKIVEATQKFTKRDQKYYVIIRKFGRTIHLAEKLNGQDIYGDCLIAVIKNCEVRTVMMGKSWWHDYFNRDGKLVQ
jgi:hypothetical protein